MATVQEMAEALAAEDGDDGAAPQSAIAERLRLRERTELEAACDLAKGIVLNVEGARWEAYAAAPLERPGCFGVCLRRAA